ncbi:hypothetical protein BHE74_00021030, partial [Ensete ventricosum]
SFRVEVCKVELMSCLYVIRLYALMPTFCIYKPVTQVKKFFSRSSSTIGRAIESMLKIGRLNTASGLDLPQVRTFGHHR